MWLSLTVPRENKQTGAPWKYEVQKNHLPWKRTRSENFPTFKHKHPLSILFSPLLFSPSPTTKSHFAKGAFPKGLTLIKFLRRKQRKLYLKGLTKLEKEKKKALDRIRHSKDGKKWRRMTDNVSGCCCPIDKWISGQWYQQIYLQALWSGSVLSSPVLCSRLWTFHLFLAII